MPTSGLRTGRQVAIQTGVSEPDSVSGSSYVYLALPNFRYASSIAKIHLAMINPNNPETPATITIALDLIVTDAATNLPHHISMSRK